MNLKRKQKTHEQKMRELAVKYKIAKQKRNERILRYQIIKMSLPFRLTLKFNKLIVLLSIVAIISYTIAAILLQKYTMTELSPTLTTCVYAFFGTELLGLASIKICATKFTQTESSITENINESDVDS